jgi:hypothetical protein
MSDCDLSYVNQKLDSIKSNVDWIRSRIESSDYGWVKRSELKTEIDSLKSAISEVKSSCAK